MSLSITISSVNYNGHIWDITFYPLMGGVINVGLQTIPYTYFTDYLYGTCTNKYWNSNTKVCITNQ